MLTTPLEIETGILAGIRQDYLLFLSVIGSFHFVLMAIGTTFSAWGENAGRRLFLGLAVAGSCMCLMVFVQLTAFVWILDSPAIILACDLLRFLAAAGLLWAGCALSPRFTWVCAAVALAAIGLLAAGLATVLGLRGVTIGTGIGIFGAAAGLVIHILRFQRGGRLAPGTLLPLLIATGLFGLVGVDVFLRVQTSWAVVNPWLIVPAIAPWAAGMGLWIFNDGVRPIARLREIPAPRRLFSLWFFPTVQMLILILGWGATEFLSRPAARHSLQHLELQMLASVSAVNPTLFGGFLDRATGHDPIAGELLQRSLDTIRAQGPGVEAAYLWRMESKFRRVFLESRQDDQSVFQLPISPTVTELKGILERVPVMIVTRPEGGSERFVASAPVFSQFPDRVVGWMSLILKPDEFVRMIAGSRAGLMAVVGLISLLGTGVFALLVRGQIENDLRIGIEKAEVADRAKSEFLAIMSHEIRTPLQSVLGYTDLVIDSPLDDSQRHQIQLIRSQGRTLMRIVQDILDFSAMRRGSFSLQLKTILLRKVVEEVVGTVSSLADRKGLGFDFSIADDLPAQVLSDSVRLRQVLFNIISNAIKYTPRGRVMFDVHPDPLEADSAQTPTGRVTVVFRVTDTGIGIPDHVRSRLFEPFFRAGSNFTEDEGGAGLGLAIVRRLCELMGASISIESAIGKGTTVEIRAPFEQTSVDTSALESILPPLDGEDGIAPPVLAWELPMSVLLVEDNTFIQGLFAEYLRKIGYQADVVGNGRDAVAACLQTPYDLILMDLKLPEMSGPEAVREIRRIVGNSEHPWIIGLSASTRDEDINEAMNAGMNDFLAKPINLRGLVETILFSPLGQGIKEVGNFPVQSTVLDDPQDDWMAVAGAPNRERAFALFVLETPLLLDAMRQAHTAGDLAKVRNRAHYIKNSGLYLKDRVLADLCDTICKDADNNRHHEVALGLDALEDLVVTMITSEAMA